MRTVRRLNNHSELRIDYGIILNVMILAIIGLASLYATTVMIENKSILPTLYHALWYCIGAIAILVAIQFDSEQYWKLSTIFYGVGLVLLIAVLFFHDRGLAADTGARSWFRLGPISFQPSEIFKIAYIVFMARIITEHNNEYTNRSIKTDWLLLGKILLFAAPALFLIQRQNDLGTNLVLLAITAGMVLMSGISWKILLPITLAVTIVGGVLIYLAAFQRDFLLSTGLVRPYQIARIDSWFRPFDDTRGDAYQLAQSIKAIGSGQLSGKGFGVSQVPVPVRESDFIFTTIGENFGFIGAGVLLFVYFMLIYQMVQTCFETKNEFYTYIATGVITMIMFHILENIGMNIGLLPITGIPLPFVSQGGSALLGNMIGIGLILSMRYHHRSYMFSSQNDSEF